MNARFDIDIGEAKAAEIVGSSRQRDVVVFGLCAPIAADGEFKAEARRPPGLILSDRKQLRDTVGIIDVDMRMAPGETAGDERHEAVEGIADAAAHGADIVDCGVEGGR